MTDSDKDREFHAHQVKIINAMSEKELEDNVLDMALMLGWLRFHALPARSKDGERWRTHQRGDIGFPDLLLIHPKTGRIAAFELKTEKAKPTPAQQEWIDAWLKAEERATDTIAAGVWRPSDWFAGTIEDTLFWGTKG